VGKDALLTRMREERWPLHFVVTATTRPRRPSEADGVDYHFLAAEEFERRRQAGMLLEWAQVYGNMYGIPREEVVENLAAGRDVIVKTDVQGARTIRKLAPEATFIFVAPASTAELASRLNGRRTESAGDMGMRVKAATEEMKCLPEFDYVVANEEGKLEETLARIRAIMVAEKSRVHPRRVRL